MPNVHFRAGTVAVVRDSRGRILAFERSDHADQWQLPQGGLDVGETPVDGAWRELREETGLDAAHVDLVGEYPEWTVYEWPREYRPRPGTKHDGRRLGQAQRWFMFDARSDDIEPVPDGVEFVSWRWVQADWLIDQVIDFRRPAYRRVLGA